MKDHVSVGEELCWIHGEHYRIAKVLEVTEDEVYLEGSSSKYWIKTETLLKKINKPEVSYTIGG